MTAAPQTFREICQRYCTSPEMARAAWNTRRQRERAIERALRRFGDVTIEDLEHRGFRGRLYDWRDTFRKRPSEGHNNIKVVCTILNWAVDRGWLRDNPAAGIRPLQKRVSHAETIWTREEIEAVIAVSPRPLADIIAVGAYTGLRESDILRINKDDIADGWLCVTPKKTRNSSGVRVELPYHLIPELAEIFGRLAQYRWSPGEPIMRRPNGLRWSERWLRQKFTEAKRVAGLGDSQLRFHDLRGTLTTWLLEAGCTDAELGAVIGGALAKGNKRAYAARTRELAINAFRNLARKLEKKDE